RVEGRQPGVLERAEDARVAGKRPVIRPRGLDLLIAGDAEQRREIRLLLGGLWGRLGRRGGWLRFGRLRDDGFRFSGCGLLRLQYPRREAGFVVAEGRGVERLDAAVLQ